MFFCRFFPENATALAFHVLNELVKVSTVMM